MSPEDSAVCRQGYDAARAISRGLSRPPFWSRRHDAPRQFWRPSCLATILATVLPTISGTIFVDHVADHFGAARGPVRATTFSAVWGPVSGTFSCSAVSSSAFSCSARVSSRAPRLPARFARARASVYARARGLGALSPLRFRFRASCRSASSEHAFFRVPFGSAAFRPRPCRRVPSSHRCARETAERRANHRASGCAFQPAFGGGVTPFSW